MRKKERPNSTIKHKSVVSGVIMMYIGTLNGMIYEKVEYGEGYKNEMYLTSYGRTQYAPNYNEVTIESVKNNHSVTIINQEDLREIYRKTKEEPYGWAPITDLNIDFEPDLYIKYSDNSVIGFCEETPFIRVDEDGVSVWYIGPSDIYTFMRSKYLKY